MPRHLIFRPSSTVIGHIALALIGLILIAPLLQAAPLCTDDGALHLYRTVALDRALGDGLLYPRWFPDLAYGYGFPFFNYREPLGYYALEGLHLIGASFPLALNLLLALSVIVAGQTMMLWISDIFNLGAGFVAGLVYMAAPYTLIDALTRANLPESLALALMPLILWAFRRLLIHGGRRYFFIATLSYAALLLTHNISSLIFTPILIAYCVLRTPYGFSRTTHHPTRWALLAITLSLTLTAFFWLPALTEGNYAQLYLTHSTHGNDYHFNFLSFGELFGGPGTSDPTLLNPPLRILLGWPQIIIAIAGVLVIRKVQSREQRAHIVAAALLLIACVFMALPISLPVWDNLPLIRFVQFPWRFVGRAILPAALLAGAATYAVTHSSLVTRHSYISVALSLCLSIVILIFAAPQLYPRVCTLKDNLTITDVFNYERATGHIGVDPLGAYLPATVKERPNDSPLEAQYANGSIIQRFDRSPLPNGAQVQSETYQPNHAAIDLTTPINFRATYLTFDFPGWQVSIDDQPASIVPSDPNGLITFDVPAGQHRIEVKFGSTPIRTASNAISVVTLLGLALSLVRVGRGMNPPASERKSPKADWLVWLSVPMLFGLLKISLIDQQLTPLRQSQLQGDRLSGAVQPIAIDFGNQLRLIGYEITPRTAPSGDTIRVDLYWRALQKIDVNYQTTVGIVDNSGEIWSPKTLNRPRDYQDHPVTTQWPTGAYVMDSFELPINPGTPPGTYAIFAEVFTRDTLQPLPAAASVPHPASRPAAAIITPLAVTSARRTFNADELGIYNFRFDRAVTADLKLLGLNLDRSDVLPGDTVLLTFFWQTATPIDHTLTIHLIDAQQHVAAENKIDLRSAQWAANAQLIDLRRVRVRADLASGLYRWRGLIDGAVVFETGDLRVTAPDRSFSEPAIQHRIDQTLGGQVTLLGYDRGECAARGAQCAITLYWRAEQELAASSKVFVQLLDANGVPRAQVDAVPLNGTRSTTSWLPGEILTDPYTLQLPADLPAGAYRLVTGLYQELNNTRLTLPDGRDAIELGTLEFSP